MITVLVDKAEFWEFKARTSQLDLEIAQWRMRVHAVIEAKNDLVTAFAVKHGLDPAKPLTLEDSDYSVTQADD